MTGTSPGPWRVDMTRDSEIRDRHDDDVAELMGEAVYYDANAALIAAAPELRDALRDTLNALTLWADEWGPGLAEKVAGYREFLARLPKEG